MSRTLFTGWRTVTPGRCLECGDSESWGVDGRGNIMCQCQACPDCSELDAYGFHAAGCPRLDGCPTCGSPSPDGEHCPDCAADWALVATS